MLSNNYISSDDNETEFQKAYSSWVSSDDPRLSKIYWDKMWFCVLLACTNIAKRILTQRNKIIEDERLEEISLDAAAYCMRFIKEKNVHPDKLSSYCYLRVMKFMQEPKNIWYEQNVMEWKKDEKGNYVDLEGEYYA